MKTRPDDYLLENSSVELERLRLQAQVWEPDTERMLDEIGIKAGSNCVDLGCGAMGILGPLSRRVGPTGHVLGIELDPKQSEAASAFIAENSLNNAEVLRGDAYQTKLPRESFDFTHVRFLFAPVGRDEELLDELLGLTCPGGIVAIQEPIATSWDCYPTAPSWQRLKAAIIEAFRRGGGDFNVGRRTYKMLQDTGLEGVRMRAAVLGLPYPHPYRRLAVQFATSLRQRILEAGILGEAELDDAIAKYEQVVNDPDVVMLSFIVTQVWGRKPTQVR
jgi:ubiquinone/menaquinone biosynthesis C-methylase UbiE